MRRWSRRRSRAGRLATWEILALGLIAASVVVGGRLLVLSDAASDARAVTVKRLQLVCDALDKYAVDNGGSFPSAAPKGPGLSALVDPPDKGPRPVNWKGPYLKDKTALRDGWGQDFNYLTRDEKDPLWLTRPYDLWSNGASGREGGTGANAEIDSWDRKTWLPPPP
jgi:general secretion pathway protein G